MALLLKCCNHAHRCTPPTPAAKDETTRVRHEATICAIAEAFALTWKSVAVIFKLICKTVTNLRVIVTPFYLVCSYLCTKRIVMNANNKMNRRNFIKTSVAAGGALLASTAIPGQAMNLLQEQKNDNKFANDGSLKGVCDIHLHCRPDSRSVDEYGFMKDAMAAGYRAVMFKSNDFSCHDRAYIIRQALPCAECFGSFCMNRVHGDRVNPFAARKAVETSGGLCRCIWMPTLDAAYQYQSEGRKEKGIPVLDDNGQVLPEVVKVMEICAEADIIFATGHASSEESITLVRKAHEVGVKRIVITHANSSIWTMTPEQIKRCIDLGAYIEYCYLPCLWGEGTKMPQYQRQSIEEFASFIRIDPTRSFISTDLGQAVMPHPVEGMRDCILKLQSAGVSQSDIDLLVRRNPAWLIGVDK